MTSVVERSSTVEKRNQRGPSFKIVSCFMFLSFFYARDLWRSCESSLQGPLRVLTIEWHNGQARTSSRNSSGNKGYLYLLLSNVTHLTSFALFISASPVTTSSDFYFPLLFDAFGELCVF